MDQAPSIGGDGYRTRSNDELATPDRKDGDRMDAGRFDALSRSIAARSSRRNALKGLGGAGLSGGLLATFGLRSVRAANGDPCSYGFSAVVAAGPDEETTYEGELSFTIGPDGAIDEGSL